VARILKTHISILLLVVFNGLLIVAGWVMAVYSYPRLPEQIPYWLNLAGQDEMVAPRFPLFFVYPLAQTVFVIAFWLAARIWVRKPDELKKLRLTAEGLNTGLPIQTSGETAARRAEQSPGELSPHYADIINSEGTRRLRNEASSDKALIGKKAPTADISDPGQREFYRVLINLKKEFVLLELIFFNLIFIHIQRSLIWLAHELSVGVNKFYFFSLIMITLLLIPYYRLRHALLTKMLKV